VSIARDIQMRRALLLAHSTHPPSLTHIAHDAGPVCGARTQPIHSTANTVAAAHGAGGGALWTANTARDACEWRIAPYTHSLTASAVTGADLPVQSHWARSPATSAVCVRRHALVAQRTLPEAIGVTLTAAARASRLVALSVAGARGLVRRRRALRRLSECNDRQKTRHDVLMTKDAD
jgi:hypothetical protein